MKSSFSKDSISHDASIRRQAGSALYAILSHEEHENERLPISPNGLRFLVTEDHLSSKFLVTLYCDSQSSNKPSKEFQYNLFLYYLYLIGMLIINIIGESVLYFYDMRAFSIFLFHIICTISIVALSLVMLYMILKIPSILLQARNLISLLSVVVITYIILGDGRVLNNMLGEEDTDNIIDSRLMLIAYLVMLRIPLFDCFYSIAALTVFTYAVYLAMMLTFSKIHRAASVTDFFILCLFLCIQLFEVHQVDYRTKQLFWRRYNEEKAMEPAAVAEKPENEAFLKTEIEMLVKTCDKIASNVKAAISVIMFKDVKNMLKSAVIDIEKIKYSIVRGAFGAEVHISENKNIDEDDRLFIAQMFMDVGHSTSVRNTCRLPSALDIHDATDGNFPFKDYGVQELESVLFSLGRNWNFDIWFVYEATGHSIYIVAKYLIRKWNLCEMFDIPEPVADRYFTNLEKSYHKNPYHNACHAADVLHSMLFYIYNSEIAKYISGLETLSVIIACLAHDLGHPGLTNRFLVNNRDKLALQYNDNSVLENMHCAKLYEIMNKPECDILQNLTTDDWLKSRKLIIEMILATDMNKHFGLLGTFRTRAVNLSDVSLDKEEDKGAVLVMGLKCGDLSHSAKVIELHEKWTNLVCEEFFNQGDIEKQRNLPVSMYCDRDTTDIPKSQAGFIKNICLPLFETWCSFLKSDIINQSCLENLKKNLRHWEDKSKSRRATAPGIKNVDIEELKRVSKYGTVEALVPKNLEN
jgi:hypothetical protein